MSAHRRSRKPVLRMRFVQGEEEKFCLQCQEWWPATTEFFFLSVKGYLRSPCKACIESQKQETNSTHLCCVPGCTNLRHRSRNGRYSHRCWEHRYYVAVTKTNREEATV